MAKGNSLSDAIQNMIDDVERATAFAGVFLKSKVQKDFEDAARTSVDKYYSYKNGYYTRYGRQHRLYKVYDVKTDVHKENGNIVVSTGIYMDSDRLEGLYHSNSSLHKGSGSWEAGGDVEADYVFENFIRGIHPWTNGWPRTSTPFLEYDEIRSKPSPDNYLNRYRDKYADVYFSKHIQKTMDGLLKAYM